MKCIWATPSLPVWYRIQNRVTYHTLPSPKCEILAHRIRQVTFPLYHTKEVREMVAAEEELIREVIPDLILYDFRNTLAISGYGKGIPLISLNDFYWSESYPYTHLIPDTPLSPYIGYARARKIGAYFAPMIEKFHIAPFNEVASMRGIAPFRNLRHLYNSADQMWFFDIASVLPYTDRTRLRCIGPLAWERGMESPEWLHALQNHSALCLTFGSSGDSCGVRKVIEALLPLKIPIIVLTSGVPITIFHPLIHVADFLPMQEVLAKSSVLICTGGSSIVYHALISGVPVVGVPHNITQWYSMYRFEEMGIGELVPPEHGGGEVIRSVVTRMHNDKEYPGSVCKYQAEIAHTISHDEVLKAVREVLSE